MEARAINKYERLSPLKAREITQRIQGKNVQEALAEIDVSPRKGAQMVGKTLRSAMANAENEESEMGNIDPSDLFVKEAVVGEGPTLKRLRPKARGMAGRISKRMSHIRIVVTDEPVS